MICEEIKQKEWKESKKATDKAKKMTTVRMREEIKENCKKKLNKATKQ